MKRAMESEDRIGTIHDILSNLGIAFVEYRHKAVFTVEEAEKERVGMDGARIKNLFLRNKKGNHHYLLIAAALKEIDLKAVSAIVNDKKLGLASPERMLSYLGLTPGSVSPFGVINDKDDEVCVLVDKELLEKDKLNFHPNDNAATVQISNDGLLKFLEWSGNRTLEIDLEGGKVKEIFKRKST